jgi:predicted Zn finger-like uncharacterized protein
MEIVCKSCNTSHYLSDDKIPLETKTGKCKQCSALMTVLGKNEIDSIDLSLTNSEEQVLFNSDNVTVSNSRFIVGGQTYAMNSITRVMAGVIKGDILGYWWIIFSMSVCGIFAIAFSIMADGSGWWIALGLFLLLVGWTGLNEGIPQDKYTVLISISGGELKQILVNEDAVYINNIVTALNDAIVSRG